MAGTLGIVKPYTPIYLYGDTAAWLETLNPKLESGTTKTHLLDWKWFYIA